MEKREEKRLDAVRPSGDKANGSVLRILLVEDHEDTRHTMARLLQRWGHRVEAAASARAALSLAAEHPFDLVISDLGLPDESGDGLMSKLRDGFGIQGIAVSGYGMDHDVAKSQAAGFIYHLTKPIQVERLKQLVGKFAKSEG